eukprot:Em0006g331a
MNIMIKKFMLALAILGLSMLGNCARPPAGKLCSLSPVRGTNNETHLYNITCSSVCKSWIFYILDITPYQQGSCSNLSFTQDTASNLVCDTNVINKIGILPKTARGSWIAVNSTSIEAATMVVRCITINQTCPMDGSDGIMLRFSNRPQSVAEGLTSVQPSGVPSTTQSAHMSTEYIQPTLSTAYKYMPASLTADPMS